MSTTYSEPGRLRLTPRFYIVVGVLVAALLGLVLSLTLRHSGYQADSYLPDASEVVAAEPEVVAEPEQVAPEPEPEPEPEPVLANLGLSDEDLAALPRPVINTILPAGLPTAGPDDLLPFAAVPKYTLTPAVAEPGGEPVLALESYSDLVIEPIAARWTVVGEEPGWVRVMVPVGRGALPSVDPSAVNHQAVWVPEAAVNLEPENRRVEVSVSGRSLSVFDGDNKLASFPVGVGIAGVTETPVGLCSVIARVVIQTGAQSLLTNCQSEQLDGFAGASWSTIAVHEGTGFNQTTGGAVSNGCVRVGAANFKAYLDNLPVGAPVIITP